MTSIHAPTETLRQLSQQDFASLGLNDIAFINTHRRNDGSVVYTIHAADGTHMATAEDRDVAFASVRQHDMEPVSAH